MGTSPYPLPLDPILHALFLAYITLLVAHMGEFIKTRKALPMLGTAPNACMPCGSKLAHRVLATVFLNVSVPRVKTQLNGSPKPLDPVRFFPAYCSTTMHGQGLNNEWPMLGYCPVHFPASVLHPQ